MKSLPAECGNYPRLVALHSAMTILESDAARDPVLLGCAVAVLDNILSCLKDVEQRNFPERVKARKEKQRKALQSNAEWQRDEIMRTFRRVRKPLSAKRLHWGYLRSIDADIVRERCEELVERGELQKLISAHAPNGRYALAEV